MSCLLVIVVLGMFALLGYWVGVVQWGTPDRKSVV